ncbi:VOC family protein [soil metagenome]
MKPPRMALVGPVLDTGDPVGLAHFYERLLGWNIVALEGPRPGYPPEDGWAKLRSPTEDLKIEIQWEPHYQPPTWPTVVGEQQMMMHLDIGVADLAEGVAWAMEAGAIVADHQPQEGVRVMLDPAGHPFCLFPDETLKPS